MSNKPKCWTLSSRNVKRVLLKTDYYYSIEMDFQYLKLVHVVRSMALSAGFH